MRRGARAPESVELNRALDYVREAAGAATDREAWTSLARILLTANEFLYID
jgi:hypothetical protein